MALFTSLVKYGKNFELFFRTHKKQVFKKNINMYVMYAVMVFKTCNFFLTIHFALLFVIFYFWSQGLDTHREKKDIGPDTPTVVTVT